MTTNNLKSSTRKSFFDFSVLKIVLITVAVVWLLVKCGDGGGDNLAAPSAIPSQFEPSPSQTTNPYGDQFNEYFAYSMLCFDVEAEVLMREDLEILEDGLLQTTDFSQYLLELGKQGLQVEEEGQKTFEKYGVHENLNLTKEFGDFGRKTLKTRLSLQSANYSVLNKVLLDWKELQIRAKVICDNRELVP